MITTGRSGQVIVSTKGRKHSTLPLWALYEGAMDMAIISGWSLTGSG
jgi:hypothetical protein